MRGAARRGHRAPVTPLARAARGLGAPLVALALVPGAAAQAEGGAQLLAAEVSPIIRVDGAWPVACGYPFVLDGARIELTVARAPSGRRITLVGDGAEPVGLSIGRSRAQCLGVLGETSGGSAAIGGIGDQPAGTAFQRIAVRGATLCRRGAEGVQVGHAPGPLAQQVRAAFLQCAGDLYRQNR